ncbi:hypothetical protein CHS0354_017969 [Potamilus streckersoni]|uniref:Anoctamin n=1 Tax=Potamilus streckersoni TaxID=2493646 RepID=A0AAE0RW20_9BIVA|nr:hypothetical protein CHS0354_017969 [Potamilus streckersoni]
MSRNSSVAPAPSDSLYPTIETPAPNSAVHSKMNPIGFEATEGSAPVNSDGVTLLGFESIEGQDNTETKVSLGSKGNPKDDDNLFFNNGVDRIDYILAYEPGTGEEETAKKERRKVFERELEKEGLKLEHEDKTKSKSGKVCFVKIHAPWEVLTKYAELMHMHMPLTENDIKIDFTSCLSMCPTPFDLDKDIMKQDDDYFTAPFSRTRMHQFMIKDRNSFFSNAQRSRIVYEILSRATFEEDKEQKKKFGIKKMISNESYDAAYPLHDGKYLSEHSLLTRGKMNDRHELYEIWARWRMWYKFQPLNHIRDYFGEKIGIYFAWLGYYTTMLIPAAIVGLICFIYGCATVFQDIPTSELCDKAKSGNLTMCPLCDKRCSYWKLEDSCSYSRATYLFDNPATVFFACFMALWASFFHELWKRKQVELEYEWDIADFEQEEEIPRPEFEAQVQRVRKNPITKKEEPYVPVWSKCIRYFTTASIIFFSLCVVLGAVFGVIVYRIIITAVLYSSEEFLLRSRSTLVASGTAACINLVIILILNQLYLKIGLVLTNMEQHRTETEWEDAFTFKMFLFQFVNYYSSIFYIAFFKGRFIGRPGAYDYNLFGYRQEECDPAGCLIELCLQMAIIMVGKQAYGNFKEILLPKIMVWFRSRSAEKDTSDLTIYTRWEQDYNLSEMPQLGLFDEYLEMVIQYGFVTIFVAAFPLAPLFALLNNIFEIRIDAYKFVTTWKRPLAARAQDIGIWYGILTGITAIAIVTNAVIIAFTSEFIPRMVYKYFYSNQTLQYYDFSLSIFNVTDFQQKSIPDDKKLAIFGNVTTCRYRDFRNPPGSSEYEFTVVFWHILAARLAFIVVFENLTVFLTWLIMYLVPDMPYAVKLQMLREKYLVKEAHFTSETIKQNSGEEHHAKQPLY